VRWKMKSRRNKGSQLENTSRFERTMLLMFTLGGFGGATSLYSAEAMNDPPSNGDAARSRSSTPADMVTGCFPKGSFS
jgi:hypothetical protein